MTAIDARPSHPGTRGVPSAGSRTRWLPIALAILAGVLYFGALAPYGIQTAEDGDLLYQAYATYRGQLPYVDFSTGYTPLYFYWHALLFRVFGVDMLVARWSLAAANVATVVLIFAITARLTSAAWGALAALLFVASLPLFPGDFCSFNVPYPAWYGIALWLGSLAAVIAYAERGRMRWLVAASVLAGVNFSVKPNVGLFNLVALSLFVLWWHAPAADERPVARATWWLLAAGTLLGVLAVFQTQLLHRAFLLFPLPLLVIAGVVLFRARRARGAPGFLGAAAALAVGFALPTLPWIAYFLAELGVRRFLTDVLLLGSSYERFFLIEPRPFGTSWDLAVVVVLAAFVAVPAALRHGWLRPWFVFASAAVGAALGAVAIALYAPMRSGFQASVVMRVEDIGFLLLQVMNWIAIAVVARATAGGRRDGRAATLVALAVSSPAFTLAMYPRSDFMHLLGSVAPALILAVVLAARVAARWRDACPPGLAWRTAATALVVAPLVVPAAIMLAPGVALTAELYRYYAGADDRLEALAIRRASLVMDRDHRLIGPLRDVAAYIDRTTEPDDPVFPFPNLHLVCFLGGRLNPTAKGYFVAGYPDHASEAAIVEQLRARPPRLIVALHEHELFVTTAPLYYFLIRDYVHRSFKPVAHIGPYVVLARDGEAPPTPPGLVFTADVAAEAWPELANADPAVQWETAMRIHAERNPRGAAALAARAAHGDSPYRLLFLQVVSEFGDERAMPALIEIVRRDLELPHDASQSAGTLRTDAGDAAAQALYWLAEKSLLSDFWLVRGNAAERIANLRTALADAPVLAWLSSPDLDYRLRYVAGWLAGALGQRDAVPYLLTMVGGGATELTLDAAHALAKLGQVEGTAEVLVSLLQDEEVYAPSILLELYAADPARVRPLVTRALREGTSTQREALAWIAAAAHDPVLLAAVAAMREDPNLAVRRAAVAAVALAGDGTPSPSADVAAPSAGLGG